MIDKQQTAIFKSNQDFNKNKENISQYIKYAENWQVAMINMPDMAYVSIFMDNDLTHIMEDHFEIKLIARLLDQMYVVQPPVFPPRYDDALLSAPQFPEHLHSLLTRS